MVYNNNDAGEEDVNTDVTERQHAIRFLCVLLLTFTKLPQAYLYIP